ncbi:[NiFe] hydrogenase metallocenter assembly protein HypF [hydrothermal vent metagenome]|uniref:[NiFe] hydrogenase metallocenter assembly protein HypF n=1 Tax=hydrothermal vent metagenome TaxID=652676 RepID=A0A1W1ECZ3_9ZZZZ
MENKTYTININGTVQGVGFRPYIYKLAKAMHLYGTVSNGTNGVEILLNTNPDVVKIFIDNIENNLPPLASIDTININETDKKDFDDFKIVDTNSDGLKTVRIPPDVSICRECEKELFDKNNRRYAYPFITCTHCGVRYSIINDLPYDRENTSMKFFKMCKKCEDEYKNPEDRRYHAQPIGCWDCGPRLSLWDNVGLGVPTTTIISKTVELLKDGKILAIKGVGGYHLMCDATNYDAVMKLRERKKRPSKPFAVMVKDMGMAKELALISMKEEELLVSKERPIVIVGVGTPRPTFNINCIAPNLSKIGLFLPYTPLHLLLLEKLNRPLVATSANVTDEPICTDIGSLSKLNAVYDYVLDHNRDIVNGCDDSVVMVVNEEQIILRRARGYAPASIKLPFSLSKNVIALGANQKNTIAIAFENEAIVSPHIGDLDTIESVEYFKRNIATLERIYSFKVEEIKHDKHPNYESTKVAKELANYYSLDTTHSVQHHYAHILAVMAEKKINSKVLGVSFDGTGYGDDGNLWGGEFLICDYKGYERVAQIEYFKLLGGDKAIKEPRRVALSLLFDLYGKDVLQMQNHTTKSFSDYELKSYFRTWEKSLNAPLSSSVGRLFDAVASLVGVCQIMSFEGESGMLLEELYDDNVKNSYSFYYENNTINILPLVKEVLEEKNKTVAVSMFFNTLVDIIVHISKLHDLPIVLSGGVFQNRILLGLVLEKIPNAIISNNIPPNDGGIALGQVVSV